MERGRIGAGKYWQRYGNISSISCSERLEIGKEVGRQYTKGGSRGFKSPQHMKKHFTKHNEKFDPPFAKEQEYEQAGIEFMSGTGEEAPDNVWQASFCHIGNNFHGDLVRYDEARNLLGMKTSDVFLRTFYRPVNGILEFVETFIPRP